MLINCIPLTEQTAVSRELHELLFYSQSMLTFWMTKSQVVLLTGTENILSFHFRPSFDMIFIFCLIINTTFQ